MKLTEYLIRSADGEAYRSGRLKGMRHPAADGRMIRAVGGRRVLVEEAKELEKAGLVPPLYERVKAGIEDVLPEVKDATDEDMLVDILCR